MSLTQALNSAVSGLRVTQSGLALVAANVANAETPGYVRKTQTQVATSAIRVESAADQAIGTLRSGEHQHAAQPEPSRRGRREPGVDLVLPEGDKVPHLQIILVQWWPLQVI